MNSQNTCNNCHQEVQGDFCQHCGQREGIGKITFKETFQDFVDMVFSVNAPLMKTQKLLITNPGKLFREYLSGRRKTYYKPVSFFIIATVIYIVLRSLIQYDPMEGAVANGPKNFESSIFMKAGKYMVTNINNIMFLYVFTMALFLKTFFSRRNSFAEYVAIAFYLVGVYSIIGTIAMFYLKYVDPRYKMIPMLIFVIYMIYALTSYFKNRSFLTIVKLVFTYILSFAFYAGLGYALSFLIVWLKN
ncbi:DUF3667 domain-containing protein [Flavobacteriaceae bacterium S356]|uniref:DUF3667 domain-containing protein n=1 Tax=Asprobacillus argus TaxID=3076534 RepID=A0ABU3LF25_9FLAO|nr:DUF3667 domain-containing protein [Flavobacteriaceae bacterium S356]